MLLHRFPAFTVVELHPIVLSIFHFACVLQRLREKIPEIIVVRRILESQVTNVTKVFVKFLFIIISMTLDWRDE